MSPYGDTAVAGEMTLYNVTAVAEGMTLHNVTAAAEEMTLHNVTAAAAEMILPNVTAAAEEMIPYNVAAVAEEMTLHDVAAAAEEMTLHNDAAAVFELGNLNFPFGVFGDIVGVGVLTEDVGVSAVLLVGSFSLVRCWLLFSSTPFRTNEFSPKVEVLALKFGLDLSFPRVVLLAMTQIIIAPHMILGRLILTGLSSVEGMALKLNLISFGSAGFI